MENKIDGRGKHPNSRKNSPFVKGHKIWQGKKLSDEHKEKLRASKLGEKNPNWKGEGVKYPGLHARIKRKLGKPRLCTDCGTTKAKSYDWANISGQYKTDLSDWKRLCRKCHIAFDKNKK